MLKNCRNGTLSIVIKGLIGEFEKSKCCLWPCKPHSFLQTSHVQYIVKKGGASITLSTSLNFLTSQSDIQHRATVSNFVWKMEWVSLQNLLAGILQSGKYREVLILCYSYRKNSLELEPIFMSNHPCSSNFTSILKVWELLQRNKWWFASFENDLEDGIWPSASRAFFIFRFSLGKKCHCFNEWGHESSTSLMWLSK